MKAAPRHSAKAPAVQTLRWRKTRGGTVASSPRRRCRQRNRARRAAEAARRERTGAEAQGWDEPPHWRARRRAAMEGVKRRVPSGSRRRRRWGQVRCVRGRRGSGKRRRMTRIVTAPWGC